MNIAILILLSWFMNVSDSKVLVQEKPDHLIQFNDSINHHIYKIWSESILGDTISFELFSLAMKGYYSYESFHSEMLTIIDFSRPSNKKRLYVIDLKNQSLKFHTLVSHGKNTGENHAVHFSNKPKSLKSSLGFYKTAETYYGKHGYSLRLDGLEDGINNNARKRAIVIHGADYVSKNFIKKHGRLGRSFGCPALPITNSKDIIDIIANGSCLFIYSDDESYLNKSSFLK